MQESQGLYKCQKTRSIYTVVQEQEASKAMSLTGCELLPEGLFVIWKWDWMEPADDEDGDDDTSSLSEKEVCVGGDHKDTSCDESEPEVSNGANGIKKHTVTFKCIGSSRDMEYQESLSLASKKMKAGEVVPVKLCPEPTNAYDARAIAFKIALDDEWKTVGYIVREALDSVHKALANEEITNVEINWIKYLIHWSRCGPGWYTGINITKFGDWESHILQCSSAVVK